MAFIRTFSPFLPSQAFGHLAWSWGYLRASLLDSLPIICNACLGAGWSAGSLEHCPLSLFQQACWLGVRILRHPSDTKATSTLTCSHTYRHTHACTSIHTHKCIKDLLENSLFKEDTFLQSKNIQICKGVRCLQILSFLHVFLLMSCTQKILCP